MRKIDLIKELNSSLELQLGADIKYLAAIKHALNDALKDYSDHSDIGPKELLAIQKTLVNRLDLLVKVVTEGSRRHWISSAARDTALKVFSSLIKELPATTTVSAVMLHKASAATPAPVAIVASVVNDNTPFKINDHNYAGYSEEQVKNLQYFEHCCSYPKLALYLEERHPINRDSAAIINAALRILKAQDNTTLTAADILKVRPDILQAMSRP